MPFNGAGTFSLASGNPVVTGTVISSTWANNTLSDLASNGLTNCLTKDGQQTPTANIQLGGFQLTNVGNATTRGAAPNAGQIQDGGLTALGAVSGSDTITAASSPSITAYVSGQMFDFIATGANATNAVTLNISGLGAKNVTKNGTSALAVGDIRSGQVVSVMYDGTRFQMVSPIGLDLGRLLNVQIFSVSGTYTPTTGTSAVVVELVGGGGGGGGCGATSSSQAAVASGGGAGSFAKGRFTSAFSGVTVTVGAGGNGGATGANAGAAGGTTSFGALMSAPGGNAGPAGTPAVPPLSGSSSGISGTPSGANIVSGLGASTNAGVASTINSFVPSSGAASVFGGGGIGFTSPGGNGQNASSVGSGGGGASSVSSQAGFAGGAGFKGIAIIYEYGTGA